MLQTMDMAAYGSIDLSMFKDSILDEKFVNNNFVIHCIDSCFATAPFITDAEMDSIRLHTK